MGELEILFEKRPIVKTIYEKGGTLREYLETLLSSQDIPSGGELIDRLAGSVNRVYSWISAERAAGLLRARRILSYADHHGLLHFRLLYNSNIIYMLHSLGADSGPMIVLSSGIIPMDNISYPRGFHFQGNKYNFFSYAESRKPVYLFDSKISVNGPGKLRGLLSAYNHSLLTEEQERFLEYLFFEVLGIEDICEKSGSFSEQISLLNHRLWPLFFEEGIRKDIPELLYVQTNDTIISYLSDTIRREGSLVSRILFDDRYRHIYLRAFSGIGGCWDEAAGPHFFNFVDSRKKLRKMTVSADGKSLEYEDTVIPLEPGPVCDALAGNRILPTLFFDFLLMTFMEGHTVVGGFNQAEYLTQMKLAHTECLNELGEEELACQFASRRTDGLICGMTPLKYGSSIDMLWHFNSTGGKFNGNLDKGLTLEDLEEIRGTPVRTMILDAAKTMAGIVS